MRRITIEDFEEIFKNRTPRSIGTYSCYSVLVPLVEKEGELHILYEVRSDFLKKQPGEVCFPGGKLEYGESAEACAIRETSEELNILAKDIKVISQLDYIHTYSNFTMYSFLGIIDYEVIKKMNMNKDEVKEVFLVPLTFFLETQPDIYDFDVMPKVDEDFPYDKINFKTGYNWRKGKTTVPIYYYGERVIWGLTARITWNMVKIITHKD